jgi:hypothetical protein
MEPDILTNVGTKFRNKKRFRYGIPGHFEQWLERSRSSYIIIFRLWCTENTEQNDSSQSLAGQATAISASQLEPRRAARTSTAINELHAAVLLEQLIIVAQLANQFRTFYGTTRFISFHKKPSMVRPESDEEVHTLTYCLFNINFNIILPSTPAPQVVSFIRHFKLKVLVHLSFLSIALRIPPFSSSSAWSS